LRHAEVDCREDAHGRIVEISLSLGHTDQTLALAARASTVEVLDCMHSEVTDEGLRHVIRLTHLRELNLLDTSVTGAGLRHIAKLKSLRSLAVNPSREFMDGLASIGQLHGLEELSFYAEVPPGGLRHLVGLRRLQKLSLSLAVVADGDFVHVATLPNLRRLAVDNEVTTDEAMAHIARCARLEELIVGSPRLTDNSFEYIQKMPVLRTLVIRSPKINGHKVFLLKNCTRLTYLKLSECSIDESMFRHLVGLTSLRELDISNTRVTKEGASRLRKLMPWCDIDCYIPDDNDPLVKSLREWMRQSQERDRTKGEGDGGAAQEVREEQATKPKGNREMPRGNEQGEKRK